MNRAYRSWHRERLVDSLYLVLQVAIPLNSRIPNGQYKWLGYQDQYYQKHRYNHQIHQFLLNQGLRLCLYRAALRMKQHLPNTISGGYRSFRTRHSHK